MPSFGGFLQPKRRTLRKKTGEFSIAPSFSAIVGNLGMSSSLKVSKDFGVTPFQTRGLLRSKSGKAKKIPYFTLTD